jgi:pyruvate kinase
MAKWRPETPIVAITPRTDIVKRLALNWGVYALPNSMFINTDNLLQELPHLLKYLDFLNTGDNVIITAGIPINKMLPTNMIKINKIP